MNKIHRVKLNKLKLMKKNLEKECDGMATDDDEVTPENIG